VSAVLVLLAATTSGSTGNGGGMRLGGTLLVALVGGSAGSGLALFGGLKLQERQHGFEHQRWIRGRMADAAASFGGVAAATQTLLTEAAWKHFTQDKLAIEERVLEQIELAGQQLVSVPLVRVDLQL
jgi:hypothetical protein